MKSASVLMTLAFAAVLLAPAASAAPTLSNPVRESVDCLLGPHTPETMVYYIVWSCTAGQYVPEPVQTYTGCKYVFAGEVQCSGGASDLVFDLTGCRIGFPYGYCLQ